MVRAAPIAALLSTFALLSCANDEVPPTQLMLVVDTDIAELNEIAFDVSDPRDTLETGSIPVDIADAPFTMAVLREKGSLGPLTARAIGYAKKRPLVERSAVVSFSPGKTLTVVLHLVQSCRGKNCEDDDETCTERGCELADAGTLSEWDGTPPTLEAALDAGSPRPDASQPGPDAGPPADGAAPQEAGADAAEPDAGGAVWTRCGFAEVDINSDVGHCGRCNNVCRVTGPGRQHVVAACVAGACGVSCEHLWGDCDGDDKNGCENWMSYDAENCGGCGLTCQPEEYCWLGECLVR
jgi:hypothetical protein